MRAGKLRYVITVQKLTVTKDAVGGQSKTWADFLTGLRAEKITSGGREFYAAQKMNEEVQVVFKTRYVGGVTSKHRVLCGGVEYDILHAADPDGRERELLISCRVNG